MTIDLGPLHPRHGPHEPTSGTPARTPGSLRRTATTDMLRPEGLSGPLVLRGRARDLHTAVDGSARVLGESSTYAVVDFVEGRRLRAVTTVPHRPALSSLLGRSVCGGFADGGTLMNGVDREGAAPLVTGPAAPALLDPDDPLGWHAMDRLPPDA